MSTLEEYMQRATAPGSDRKIPGAVLIVANKDGAWELAAEYSTDRLGSYNICCFKVYKLDANYL